MIAHIIPIKTEHTKTSRNSKTRKPIADGLNYYVPSAYSFS